MIKFKLKLEFRLLFTFTMRTKQIDLMCALCKWQTAFFEMLH